MSNPGTPGNIEVAFASKPFETEAEQTRYQAQRAHTTQLLTASGAYHYIRTTPTPCTFLRRAASFLNPWPLCPGSENEPAHRGQDHGVTKIICPSYQQLRRSRSTIKH